MRRLIMITILGIAACEGNPVGSADFIEIPTAGPKKATTFEEAKRRATAWCRKQGHREAVADDDGDPRYRRFACH